MDECLSSKWQIAFINPLEGNAVVLIDEIDLHLHPQWQRAVIPRLETTFPHCQFIVSTHSPQVISEVGPQNRIYFLRMTEDGMVAEWIKNAYGKDTNFILEVFMETDERPENIKTDIEALSELIDTNQLNEAQTLLQQLKKKIGDDEPALVGAEILIRRKEMDWKKLNPLPKKALHEALLKEQGYMQKVFDTLN